MATIPITTSVPSWNRATRHVESQLRSGRYVNAETTLVVAGPPRVADISVGLSNFVQSLSTTQIATGNAAGTGTDPTAAGANALYPIGLLEQVSINQVQSVQKIFEIGSRRSYQAGGRVQVVGSIGRIQFNGTSLLRALYAYYPSVIAMANGKALGAASNTSASSGAQVIQDTVLKSIAITEQPGIFPEIFFEPGSFAAPDPEDPTGAPAAFLINLMSELFSHPFGLGFLLRDNKNNNYGAIYLEDCFITAHSWQIGSASTLITETASFQADAAVPMEFAT